MALITLGGNPTNTIGELPNTGTKTPDFTLTTTELSTSSLSDFTGSNLVLNIFPSVDTGVCATSIRTFNKTASSLENTKVLCISRDLPFAQGRFCGAEGIENVIMLSDFADGSFGKSYGVEITEGPFNNLHSRAIVVVNPSGEVVYTEQVPEVGQEPNYEKALAAIQ